MTQAMISVTIRTGDFITCSIYLSPSFWSCKPQFFFKMLITFLVSIHILRAYAVLGRTELRYGSDQIARRHSVHVLKLKTYDVIEVERMPSECCYFFVRMNQPDQTFENAKNWF